MNKFPFLNYITEENELYHNMLIFWEGPVVPVWSIQRLWDIVVVSLEFHVSWSTSCSLWFTGVTVTAAEVSGMCCQHCFVTYSPILFSTFTLKHSRLCGSQNDLKGVHDQILGVPWHEYVWKPLAHHLCLFLFLHASHSHVSSCTDTLLRFLSAFFKFQRECTLSVKDIGWPLGKQPWNAANFPRVLCGIWICKNRHNREIGFWFDPRLPLCCCRVREQDT